MPNGDDKNLIRLYEVVSGFIARYGDPPVEVRLPTAALEDLFDHVLSLDAQRRLRSLVRLIVDENAFAATDGKARRYDYLSSRQVSITAGVEWLGLEPPGVPPPGQATGALGPDPSAEYLKSSFYEQLVEHVFIAELLQEAWFRHHETVEVLRSEIDASGFDLVLECRGVLRHIQLKTSRSAARTAAQKVSSALGSKPSGCVVWILRNEDLDACRMRLSYLFFGAGPGMPLPDLSGFRVAKHTKADSTGTKKARPGLRIVPKSRFEPVTSMGALLCCLFGLPSVGDSVQGA